MATYGLTGTGVVQLALGANESVTVTTLGTGYTFSLSSGTWTGPEIGGFTDSGTVLAVDDLSYAVSIVDSGAGSSVTFGTSVNYFASFTVALTNAAAGSITFAAPTNFVDDFGTPTLSASTTKNIVVNAGVSTVNGSLTLSANQQATATTGTFVGVDLNSATVKTTGGALSIAGKGGATSGVGVLVRGTGVVETTGTSSITVTGATGASSSFGIQLAGTSIVRKSTGTGSITLIGDTMDFAATSAINAGTANTVNLRQRTSTVAINIGADTLAATPVLGLTDAELDVIAAATVNIGNASSGPISVSGVISPLNYKTLNFGKDTTFGATSGFASRIGPTKTIFDKIAVTGTVAITAGATFTPVAAGYVPVLLDSFTFIDNDSTDAITGSFTLPSLANFLGSTFTGLESYAAGTGNDFVIAVPRNIAPTFTMGANPSINEDAGPQTIVGWATGITSGGDPLPVQSLTFTTSGFNASLFSVSPVVNPTTGTLTFTSAPDAFGTTAVTLTLQDSGGTLNGGVDTTVKTFTITINPVNDEPIFTIGSNQTVNEDGGPVLLTGFLPLASINVGPANETDNVIHGGFGNPHNNQSNSAVTIAVTNNNPSLFLVPPSIDPLNGNLTYQSNPDANGVAIVTITVQDTGGIANGGDDTGTRSFTITVNPVNDMPVFAVGGNVNANEDVTYAAAQATGISDSDPEVAQTLTFTVTNSNNSLFSVQPSISATGQLTFTAAPNANGTATVTVTLTDDATAGGPALTTASQTFTITVNPVNDM
ncbi:MAG: Ig-like domain-containing protein, partial [Planctomycetota bacterium]|nr:Ig-like domain-containing protein [Planctomycetota bacterium]